MMTSFYVSLEKLRARLIAHLITQLDMVNFKYRGLTQGEIHLAQPIFGNLIDYRLVKIFNIPYLPWQPPNVFIAPNGHLFVHPKYFCSDYSLCSIVLQGIFIHELAHVLQFQQKKQVLFKGALLQLGYYLSGKHYNPYQYQWTEGKPFSSYNIEQQGDIARDIFLGKIPNIILEK